MNKILSDYITNLSETIIPDKRWAEMLAYNTWRRLVSSRSRGIIANDPALRRALIQNHLPPDWKDSQLRVYLREEDDR